MNKIITTHVMYRGQEISVSNLKDNSNLKITVECRHGQRLVKWVRRNQLCKKCAVEAGIFNTSKMGRDITWGDKISEAKKGKKFSEAHKEALSKAHVGKKHSEERIQASLKNRRRGDRHPSWKNINKDQKRIKKDVLDSLSSIARKMRNCEVVCRFALVDTNLSYTVGDFIDHIENLFTDTISWDNYGSNGWTIDHILPDSWLSYNDYSDEDFKKSFSLENLQPSFDNFIKGNRYEG